MKKIVALGAAAALIGGLFAAEPASNPSVVSFTGNASVEWGVDLDAGKTGFKNGTWTELKLKLFDAGTKETSGDGVWAELKIKADDSDSCGIWGAQDNKWKGNAAAVDVAKLHFNNIYVGIQSGDTQVGELDFTTAVRSADPWYHPGRWLTAVGPANFTQGIVAGYEDDNMNLAVDFRSYSDGQYTDAYAVAGEFKIKDSNSFAEGLSVGLGAAYNLNDFHFGDKSTGAVKEYEGYDLTVVQANIDCNGDDVVDDKDAIAITYDHLLGYSASVGYKLKIDDKLWLKPQVGFTGALATSKNVTKDYMGSGKDLTEKATANANTLAAGVIFAWGDTASYGNTGTLYYFDDDYADKAKGLTPGLSAMVYVPLPYTSTTSWDFDGKTGTTKATYHDALKALIVPSLYSGDIIENLKFAAYSEIGLFDYREKQPEAVVSGNDRTYEYYGQSADFKNTFALGLAAGVRYDIKADDITVTPKASIRYVNSCYYENKDAINAVVPAVMRGDPIKDTGMFPLDQLGEQDTNADGERKGFLAGDFFNLEAGVEVAGLINNTTFYGHYKSANLLNKTDYKSEKINNAANPNYAQWGMYNVKLGTFNVGCKISF